MLESPLTEHVTGFELATVLRQVRQGLLDGQAQVDKRAKHAYPRYVDMHAMLEQKMYVSVIE